MLARRPVSAFVVAALLLATPAPAQVTQYTITNVSQAAPGNVVGLSGLSDTGFVCGWSISSASPFDSKGFRWSAGGTFFPPPPSGVAWKTFNSVDVNDRGSVVGYFGDISPNSFLRGYRTQAGVSTELLTPLGHRAFPTAINDRGWVVGYAGIKPAGTPGAIVWTPDLVPSFVAHLASALDINNRGQVVGYAYAQDETTIGFLLSDEQLIPLGSLDPAGQGSVLPWAINDAGTVVGSSVIGSAEHAFRWTAQTGMTELPGLGFHGFPFNVAALDINAQGEIVGYAPSPSGQTGVLWHKDGSVHAIEPMVPDIGIDKSWPNLLHVMRINSAGQIVAMAAHKPSNYQARLVLLTPAALHATLHEAAAAGGADVLEVSEANPFEPVYLAVGHDDPFDTGYTPLPGFAPLGLALAMPRLLAKAITDGAGQAEFTWTIPPSLAGQAIRLQSFQLTSRKLSNVVHLEP